MNKPKKNYQVFVTFEKYEVNLCNLKNKKKFAH